MRNVTRIATSVALSTFCAVLHAAAPELPTDSGRLLQENRPAPAAPAALPPPLKAPETPSQTAPAGAKDVRVEVSGFDFTGNTVITSEQLQAAVAEWTGKPLNFGDLIQVSERIEEVYHKAGYFLAQAVLPPQKIRSGAITIAITEGRIGKAIIEGESRVSSETWNMYLDRLPKGEVAVESVVDRVALLTSELAGASANLDMQAGQEPGTTDILLVQKPSPFFTGRAELDNYGLPATGEYRLGIKGELNSPLKRGDRLTGNVVGSNTGDLHTYSLRYELPIGGNGWRTYIEKSRVNYSLGGAFSTLDASGTADSWRLGVAYPLIRSRSSNLTFQLEADTSDLEDQIKSQSLELNKKSRGISFTPSYDWQDNFLGGGYNQVSLLVRRGQMDLGADAKLLDQPPAGPDADGSFSKFVLNMSRQQNINKQLSLTAQWKQQFASTNLDSSEKISVGGSQAMVAYPVGQGTADEGGIGKLELRWQAMEKLSLGVFAEYARLKLFNDPVAAGDNHDIYRDAGFAINWQVIGKLDFAATVAWAGHQAPVSTDDDRPRVWAKFGYSW